MKKTLVIEHASVVADNEILSNTTVTVVDGKIASVGPDGSAPVPADAERVDAGGKMLTPGFIDLHMHGLKSNGVDHGPEALAAICRDLPAYGVTGWLPTLSPKPAAQFLPLISSLAAGSAKQTPESGAQVLGFHLEGPFLTCIGALPKDALGDAGPEYVNQLVDAGAPFKVICSVAPDFNGAEAVISTLNKRGLPVFMTHTAANAEQTLRGIACGIRHATHFFDVYPPLPEIEPGVRACGVPEAALYSDDVSVDFIVDGVHVQPLAIKLALKCKGPDKVCLITDAMVGSGTLGQYDFAGTLVEFKEPGMPARIVSSATGMPVGALAGSGLSMNLAVRNAVKIVGVSIPQAVRMGSANPARVLGLQDSKGRIAPGYDADLVLLDSDFSVLHTWVAGTTVR